MGARARARIAAGVLSAVRRVGAHRILAQGLGGREHGAAPRDMESRAEPHEETRVESQVVGPGVDSSARARRHWSLPHSWA